MSSDNKSNAYGTDAKSSDTSFRRTWDRDEYAAKASTREAKHKEEGQLRHEAKLAGKKYHAPLDNKSSTLLDCKDSTSRASRLDVSANVGKTVLIPAGSAVGKRGKGAGFYCGDCDLTFKDNLQFVDHLNSRQHLVAVGETGEVKRAGVEEVRERLRWLKERREAEEEEERKGRVGLRERLDGREREEEAERERKRVERRNKRREKGRRKAEEEGAVKREVDSEDDGIIC
ncbi:hypothetical protein MMC09_000319 [Bachmanniomyces sp. S44760]|nr:hypothetical protein [Bachmanniomyces sp. S44760]